MAPFLLLRGLTSKMAPEIFYSVTPQPFWYVVQVILRRPTMSVETNYYKFCTTCFLRITVVQASSVRVKPISS